jgi:hypothetical protein
MNEVKVGDMVRLPGFPGPLEVEEISGARGTVLWEGPSGEVVRSEVFLSQLQSGEETPETAERPVRPALSEEAWKLPAGG